MGMPAPGIYAGLRMYDGASSLALDQSAQPSPPGSARVLLARRLLPREFGKLGEIREPRGRRRGDQWAEAGLQCGRMWELEMWKLWGWG